MAPSAIVDDATPNLDTRPMPIVAAKAEPISAAVEFVADRDDRVLFDPALTIGPQISAALLERGVIGRAMPQGDILGFAPPLRLTREEAGLVIAAARDAVKAVASKL